MPINLGDVFHLTSRLRLDSAIDVVNRFTTIISDLGTGLDDGDRIDLLLAFVETIFAEMASFQPDNLTYDAIDVFNVTQEEPLGLFDWPTLTVGGSNSEFMPASDTIYAFARTPRVGTRASKYFPSSVETGHADGRWQSGIVNDVVDAVGVWIAPFVDGVTDFAFNAGTWGGFPTLAFNGLTSAVVRNVVQPLKSRKLGNGD